MIDAAQLETLAEGLQNSTIAVFLLIAFLIIRELWVTLKGTITSENKENINDVVATALKDNARVLEANAQAFKEVSSLMNQQHEEMRELFIVLREKLK